MKDILSSIIFDLSVYSIFGACVFQIPRTLASGIARVAIKQSLNAPTMLYSWPERAVSTFGLELECGEVLEKASRTSAFRDGLVYMIDGRRDSLSSLCLDRPIF
jgi:hypothetical protein